MVQVLTLEETAAYLRVHPSTVYRLLRNHQIPGFRIGRDWRFNQDSIDRWVVEAEKVEALVVTAPLAKVASRKSFEMKRVK
jgi:excisionase family DNA binding protein